MAAQATQKPTQTPQEDRPNKWMAGLTLVFVVVVVIPLLYASSSIGQKVLEWLLQHGIGVNQVRWLIDFAEKHNHQELFLYLTAALGLIVIFVSIVALLYISLLIYFGFTNEEAAKMQLQCTAVLLLIAVGFAAATLVVVAVLKWAWKTVFSG